MKIILNEMKKIMNIKTIGLIVIMCIIFYLIFMESIIAGFFHDSTKEIFDLSKEMSEKYGATLEQDELESFLKKRDVLIDEAEEFIKSDPVFAQAKIFSYDDYLKIENKTEELSTAERDALLRLYLGDDDNLQFKISSLDNIEYYYYLKVDLIDSFIQKNTEISNTIKVKRAMEIKNGKTYLSIMPEIVVEQAYRYGMFLAVLVVLSVLILISPGLVNDHLSNVYLLQNSSKKGRRLFTSQLLAGLFSAWLLTTCEILIFVKLYSKLGTQVFFKHDIESFLGLTFSWVDITYLQYILLMLSMIYIIASATVILSIIISRYSKNYISLVLKILPIFVLLAFLCIAMFSKFLLMSNILSTIFNNIGIEFIISWIVLILSITLFLTINHRHKTVDIC